ncbi:DUF2796 domain-containing protein [Marinobacter sp. TBZ242]|uniref:DUF2796 domain-containing protein n=1 Tax=Marinobacter azerbaijanicus TaxID=3050455 RepID=A0ABT7IC30_9GAMM|nr:DUF2796 domain-containing protein [Marinobacter sp. TBZ242]MDL0431218.1 DUF2796 domain-containing protein [Marinobacter sp. TBZ242]
MPFRISINRTQYTRRTHQFLALGCLITASTLAPNLLAANNPGAHQHGHALLQMAVEENRIDLMFSSPTHNLAGFEHEARTEDERNLLADVRAWLESTPLINTDTGDCRVSAATVELGGNENGHGDDDHGHHDEDHHDHDHHQEEETTHRDYDVSQLLVCDRIASQQAFTSALLDRFQELEELTIEWVSPSGQGSARLTSSNPVFSISN